MTESIRFNRNVKTADPEEIRAEDHVQVDPAAIVATRVEPLGEFDRAAAIELADGTVHRRRFVQPGVSECAATGKDAAALAADWLATWKTKLPAAG